MVVVVLINEVDEMLENEIVVEVMIVEDDSVMKVETAGLKMHGQLWFLMDG